MSIKMWCPNVIYSSPERADLTNKSLSSSNTGCSQPPVETRVGLMIPFFVCLFICFLTCHSLTCCQWKLGKLWALSCYPLSWCCIDLVWGILSRSLMGATGFQFCLYYQTHDSQIAPPLCSHAFLSLKPVITVQIGLHAVLWSSFYWLILCCFSFFLSDPYISHPTGTCRVYFQVGGVHRSWHEINWTACTGAKKLSCWV